VKSVALVHPNRARRPITAATTAECASVIEKSSLAEVFTHPLNRKKKKNEKNIN
jgi:hypothetical protein